jgi:hypothetical protein
MMLLPHSDFRQRRSLGPMQSRCYWQSSGLENGQSKAHIRGMRTRLSILLSVALLAAAILLVFRELHAHSVAQCGFWGSMEAGMSCR